jgi:putative ABC transport system substrate-binding protein
LEATLGGKWLELLAEITPGLKRVAIIFNPDLPPVTAHMPSLETAARSLKVALITAPVHSDAEIETAISDNDPQRTLATIQTTASPSPSLRTA